MKRILSTTLAIAGLALSAPLLAQTTTTTTTDQYGTTDTTGAGGTAGTAGTAGTTYGGTGWDPSMVMAASGALAAGSFALKGVLRRKS